MDDDLRQKAQDVFAALAVNGASFTEFLDTDFSSWRVFFRAVKDFAADQSTALAALANAGFLSRHEISVANWGKSVKERSPLFKEEFEKFIALEEVREALAKDLGVAPPPPPSPLAAVRPAASPLADKSNATFASPAPSAIAKASTSPKAAEAEVEAAPPAEPPVVAPAPPTAPSCRWSWTCRRPTSRSSTTASACWRTSAGSEPCFWTCKSAWTRSPPVT